MSKQLSEWWLRSRERSRKRRLQRDAYWAARRKQALAAQRRRQRLEALGPVAKARMEKKERARERRKYDEYQGARGLMIGMCVWARPQAGSMSIKAFALIAMAIAWMFALMLLPLMFMSGFLEIFAQKLFDLPGLKQITELFLKIACSSVAKAVGDKLTSNDNLFWIIPSPKALLGAAKDLVSSVGDAFSSVASAPFRVLSSGLKTAGTAMEGVPIVGHTLNIGFSAAAGGAATLSDATGAIVGSIPSAIEAGLSLAQLSIDALRQLQHFACSIEAMFDEFKKAGLDRAFESAVSCANWPSYLGPLNSSENSTKEGRAKYCVDGKGKNAAQSMVPAWLKPIYQAAAQQYNVPWELLAAVNWNDTEYGAKELNSKQSAHKLKVETKYASDLVNLERMFGINGPPLPSQDQQKFLDYYSIKGDRQKGAKDRAKGIISAATQVVSEWQQTNPQKLDRAGWIPLSKKEWDQAGGDWGNVPPDWRSSPYPGTSEGSPQACPMPVSTEGTAVSGTNPLPMQNIANSGAFTPGQSQFTERLAAITGLDINVVRAWVYLEMNNSYALGRESAGNFNWLNVGYFNNLNGAGAFQTGQLGKVWKNPITAADATAAFLEGHFLGASPGIRHIMSSVGMPPRAQIHYIGVSGWATSAYETQILGTYKEVARKKQPAKISVRWTHPITGKVFILGKGPAGSSGGFLSSDAPVETSFVPDGSSDTCDPVDSVFALAHWLSLHGAVGDSWNAALTGAEAQIKPSYKRGTALMIGDEMSQDMETQIRNSIAPIQLDFNAQLGQNIPGGIKKLREKSGQKKLGDMVIFALGNNDATASERQMGSWIRSVRSIAGRSKCVIWPTVWTGGKSRFVQTLVRASKNDDNLVVVRWDRVAKKYVDKNDPRGMRVNDEGIVRYGEMITQAVNQCSGGSSQPAGTGMRVTGKASAFGAIYDNAGRLVKVDPGDVVKGTNIPLNPACPRTSHRQPGVAIRPGPTYQSSIPTNCGWWWIKSPSGKSVIVQQIDVGPHQDTGRRFDLNDRAVKLFGYKGRDSFPTDQGTWTGVYIGKQRPLGGSYTLPASGNLLVVGDSLEINTSRFLGRYLPNSKLTFNFHGGDNSAEIYQRMKTSFRPSHQAILFDAGTNDIDSTASTFLARNLQKAARLAGNRCMIVPTVVNNGVRRNQIIRDFARSRPGTQVPDWNAEVRKHPGLLEPDRIHPTMSGAKARAKFLASYIQRCLPQGQTKVIPLPKTLADALSTKPPRNFRMAAVPPLRDLAKKNNELPQTRWVHAPADPLTSKFPSFKTGLSAVKLSGDQCQDQGAAASTSQQGVFYAASKTFGIPWQILSGYAGALSLYGCNGENFTVVSPGYETDASGDGVYDPSDPVDDIFSNARSLYALRGDRDPISAARKLSVKNVDLLMKMASIARQLGYNTTGMVKLMDDGIGLAVSQRDHLINKSTCQDQNSYVECIASLYRKIMGVEDSASTPGGWLTGGCNPPPVPDTNLKPFSLNNIAASPEKGAYTRSKDMKGLYLSNRTWARKDALAGEQAAIRTFLACNNSFAKNWRGNFVNDWGSGYIKASWDLFPNGHVSHRNGADNDLNIPNVTDFVSSPGAYNRKLAKSLARMLFRAGAAEIYFNDSSVENDIAQARAQFLRQHPDAARKLSGRVEPRPLFWQKNHANHFHVRWYIGAPNSRPGNVKIWVASGSGKVDLKPSSDSCQPGKDKRTSGAGPYHNSVSKKKGCTAPPPVKPKKKTKKKSTNKNPYSKTVQPKGKKDVPLD